MNNDLISRSTLKKAIAEATYNFEQIPIHVDKVQEIIDNAPTVEEVEEPFITECRNTAIKENLPLYFIYYEETGIFEVYITETKELFEKRRCSKHLSSYEFKAIVTDYLDDYSNWKVLHND